MGDNDMQMVVKGLFPGQSTGQGTKRKQLRRNCTRLDDGGQSMSWETSQDAMAMIFASSPVHPILMEE
jgi:hypothetical protein